MLKSLKSRCGFVMNTPRTIKVVSVSIAVLSLMSTSFVHADAIDDCIEGKQRLFESPKAFSKSANVTCPSGDIVGFPPRSRKHDRNGTLVYEAPSGFVIQNTGVNSIKIVNVSANNGFIGSLNLETERRVSLPFGCRGKSPGQGRAWQEVRIEGKIIRSATTDQLKDWVLECVRASN